MSEIEIEKYTQLMLNYIKQIPPELDSPKYEFIDLVRGTFFDHNYLVKLRIPERGNKIWLTEVRNTFHIRGIYFVTVFNFIHFMKSRGKSFSEFYNIMSGTLEQEPWKKDLQYPEFILRRIWNSTKIKRLIPEKITDMFINTLYFERN